MSVEKALGNRVGVFVAIAFGVVAAMVGTPFEGRILKGPSAKKEEEGLEERMGLISAMSDQAMIAGGNREARDKIEGQGQGPDLPHKSISVEVIGGESEGQWGRNSEKEDVDEAILLFS